MKNILSGCIAATAILLLANHNLSAQAKNAGIDTLPAPYATKSVMNYSDVTGWKDGRKPIAPAGFTVTRYADGFDNPRQVYVLPDGDVLIAEANASTGIAKKVGGAIIGAAKADNLDKSANRITILHTGANGTMAKKETFLEGLNQPFGMLVLGGWFYVANTDAIWRYPYKTGQAKITGKGEKIADLPDGKHARHWVRNIVANEKGDKIFIGIGSGTNVAEKGIDKELLRADILEINTDGTGMRVYASGLRNPCGMAYAPGTHTLWTSVNERDELGDELVPDYLTSVVEGGFYGWPYSYYGQHIDPRVKESEPALVARAIVPEVNLGSHTASLGLAFYNKSAFPAQYRNGAFIAQHGSWNRSKLSGYRVVYVPFSNGKPSGKPEDFLTGFIADPNKKEVYGRPVGVAIMKDGAMLVTDDISNTVWRVAANK